MIVLQFKSKLKKQNPNLYPVPNHSIITGIASMKYEVDMPAIESAIERAVAYGIDLTRLQAMLRHTPTERLEMLRTCRPQGESAVQRAAAYGIDVSLLELALTWTPTQRLQKLEELVSTVRTLHQARMKRHGT